MSPENRYHQCRGSMATSRRVHTSQGQPYVSSLDRMHSVAGARRGAQLCVPGPGREEADSVAVSPHVVATVTTLGPRELALRRTQEGTTAEGLKGATWHGGDTVESSMTAWPAPHRMPTAVSAMFVGR